ncbi:hypothetical protein [Bradyrhizobium sp. DASA03007]|uniref:hypothetical protein n=1 Tax=unclassified Bradyrhizobium TaxID=2631580 RepID=UPI003F6E8188
MNATPRRNATLAVFTAVVAKMRGKYDSRNSRCTSVPTEVHVKCRDDADLPILRLIVTFPAGGTADLPFRGAAPASNDLLAVQIGGITGGSYRGSSPPRRQKAVRK